MIYTEIPPPPHLADLIRYYWILEGEPDKSNPFFFRVLADGYPGFIFTYGSPFSWKPDGISTETIPRCFFFGVLKNFRNMSVSGKFGILGISFHSHSFHSLLNDSAHRLTNLSVEIEDLFGKAGKQLSDRLQHSKNNLERVRSLNRFLIHIQHAPACNETWVDAGLQQIFKHKGNLSIRQITRDLGISRRHFERKFKEQIGTSPKQYSRIIRFQNVLRSPLPRRLTDLAFQCGYSDQSHFIREFKEFAGFSPKAFFTETEEMVENFVHIPN